MAGRIYVTGDCHGSFSRFSVKDFRLQKDMDKEDYVIICGDFGGIWHADAENRQEKYWLDWLENKSFTTLFVDGNHESFDRLNSYPIEVWNGGKVHKIKSSIIHLMRGQVFSIAGKKIFTFGGAQSHDIQGGILEVDDPLYQKKKRELNKKGVAYRVNHFSWWKEELASEEEMQEAMKNLETHNYEVDYIITHCCSSDIQDFLGGRGLYKPDRQTNFFNRIQSEVKYKKWYFGHYHMDYNVSPSEILLNKKIIPLGGMLKEER